MAKHLGRDLFSPPPPAPPRHARQTTQDKPPALGADLRERATNVWESAVAIEGTAAEAYLRGRSLQVSGRVLRFHGACPYTRFVDGEPVTIEVPALVGLFREIHSDEPLAILRLALTADGGKAGFKPASLALGPAEGCAIKLTPDDEVTAGLTIGTSMESVLAGMMLGFRPAWALGSASRLKTFPVLAGIESLTVLADHEVGGAAQTAARAVAARWVAAEREVLRVDVGQDIADLVSWKTRDPAALSDAAGRKLRTASDASVLASQTAGRKPSAEPEARTWRAAKPMATISRPPGRTS